MAMAWVLQDCDRVLKLGEKQKNFGRIMKENLKAEDELRKKAEEQLETWEAELAGARAEIRATHAKLAQLKETFSKFWEDAFIEISRL